MRWKTIALACLGLAALAAAAQVHRCKDPSGALVFSDRPCTNNQTGGMIQLRPSAREIERERRLAAEANERKEERRAAQQAPMPAQSPAPQPMAATQPVQQVEGWQERKDRENAATSAKSITRNGGRFDERAEAERREKAKKIAAAMPPPEEGSPNPRLKKCVGDTCTNTNGVRYKKDYGQPGNLRGPSGQNCRQDPYKGFICR